MRLRQIPKMTMSKFPFPEDSPFKQEQDRQERYAAQRMSLRAWDPESYDHEELAKNIERVDAHDMSSGRGIQKRANDDNHQQVQALLQETEEMLYAKRYSSAVALINEALELLDR